MFVEANMKTLILLRFKDVLDQFRKLFGFSVNKSKSEMFFCISNYFKKGNFNCSRILKIRTCQ